MPRSIQNLFHAFSFAACVGAVLLCSAAQADEPKAPKTISGVAIVEDSMRLQINGQQIALWGIDTLAPDQQCWQDGNSWGCGEEAQLALKHYASGRTVRCEIQNQADKDGPAMGKCFRQKGGAEQDIAEHMVKSGWALDRGVQSGGAYYPAEQDAQTNKRGAWQGRFQTAQDWKEGIQRYVGEEEPSDDANGSDATATDGE